VPVPSNPSITGADTTRKLLLMILIAPLASLLFACGGGSDAEDAAASEAGAEQAHVTYVAPNNSNNLAQFDAAITDDIVYLPPNSPALVGKAAVSEFAKGYFEADQTVGVKTAAEFVVSDDWAYEHYTYKSVDTPRPDGPAADTQWSPTPATASTSISGAPMASGAWREMLGPLTRH
jgi:ketosteroid isomerase-like protein